MDSSHAVAPSPGFPSPPVALPRWKKVAVQLRGAPLIPLLILAALVFTAVFADFLATHDPSIWADEVTGVPR